jgi:hypothetical protein
MGNTDSDDHLPFSDEWISQIQHEQLDRLIDNARFVSDFALTFAVPADVPPDLIRKMLAAVKAHYAPYKSVDYVLKRHSHHWDVEAYDRDEQTIALNGILKAINAEVSSTIESWVGVPDKPGELGRVAAGAALLRLRASFKSAGLLVRVGHVYEVYAIGRMILEQTAWAYHVRDLLGEDVLAANPTKSITLLKRWIPETGRIYRVLSDHTHIPFHVSRQFVRPARGDFQVVLRSYEDSIVAAWVLLCLADIYVLVSEHVYRDCLPEYRHIKVLEDQVVFRDDRPLLAYISEFHEKIFGKQGSPDQPPPSG